MGRGAFPPQTDQGDKNKNPIQMFDHKKKNYTTNPV
jgi:hypothetical protein